MSCDKCEYYNWYYDYCRKWDCEIDGRAVHNCYEKMNTPVSDVMKESIGIKHTIPKLSEKLLNRLAVES